jgi:hypothetical protein
VLVVFHDHFWEDWVDKMPSYLDKMVNSASAGEVTRSATSAVQILSEVTELAGTEKPAKSLGSLSSPGIVNYAGMLYYPKERDRAWDSQDARDATIIEMSNNPIIGGVLRQITMFIRKVDWFLVPANDSDEARKVQKFYQEQLDGMINLWPGETMPQLLTFLTWGWAALEIIYKQLPDGRIGWDEWRLIPQETRWKWDMGENGRASKLIQLDPQTFHEKAVPMEKCIHVRDTARNNSPEGFTLLRIAYDAYFYRSGFQQLEGTLFERYGGVQVARLPGQDIVDDSQAYREIKNIVTTLGINSQTGLVLASDRDPTSNEYYQDFEIVSPASGATVPSADPIINRYANEIVGVFGAAITRTGQDGSGSYALADIQSEVFQRNMEAYLDLISDSIQNQAFPRLAEMPYNDIPLELIPTLKHGKLDKVSLKDMGAYLVSLAQAGIVEDSPELRQFTHDKASLPTPPLDVMQKEIEERKKQMDNASQQKISPLDSQQGEKTNPADLQQDPQKATQDKVPTKVKKTS